MQTAYCGGYRWATARSESDACRCRWLDRPQFVLDTLVKRWPCVKHLFDDAAYDRRTLLDKAACLDFTVEVVRGLRWQSGFQVQLQRWGRRTDVWMANALPPLGTRLRTAT